MPALDNTLLIKPHLKFKEPGDFYHVSLIRRASDDPMIGGKEDPRYHGTSQEPIHDWYITSLEDFGEKLPEITGLANYLGARAYINLNRKNAKKLDMKLLEQLAQRLQSNTWKHPNGIMATAVGHTKPPRSEQLWLIDVDEEYLPYEEWIIARLSLTEPFQQKEDLIIIPTSHGKHILCKPFNEAAMNEMWDLQSLDHPSMFAVHPNSPTLLYRPDFKEA